MNIVSVHAGEKEKIRKLSSLASAIWREHYASILSEDQLDYMIEKFQSEKAVTEQLEDVYHYYLVYEGEEAVGFIGLYPREEDLYLSKLYLDKNYRGRGIGKKMMNFVIDRARSFGKDSVVLNVNRYNEDSIAFYERYGFLRVREEDNDIGHGYFMNDYVYEFKC